MRHMLPHLVDRLVETLDDPSTRDHALAQVTYGDCLVTKALLLYMYLHPSDAVALEVGQLLAVLRHLKHIKDQSKTPGQIRAELTRLLTGTNL